MRVHVTRNMEKILEFQRSA